MNHINKSIFLYLKRIRVTSAELARKIDISKQAMQSLKTADNIKLTTYLKICEALELPYDYFLKIDKTKNSEVNEPPGVYGVEKIALNELIKQLNVKDVQISELIKAVSSKVSND